MWLQFLPEGESNTQTIFFDQDLLNHVGEKLPKAPVDTSVKLVTEDGEYQASLSFPDGQPIPHKMVTLKFSIAKNGKVIPAEELENYLGAKFHVVGISADKSDFAHGHPDHRLQDEVSAHFMQTGYYGIFTQFQHDGKVRTLRFGLTVRPDGESLSTP